MKGGNGMKEIWKEAVGNLLTVKSNIGADAGIFRSGSHKPY